MSPPRESCSPIRASLSSENATRNPYPMLFTTLLSKNPQRRTKPKTDPMSPREKAALTASSSHKTIALPCRKPNHPTSLRKRLNPAIPPLAPRLPPRKLPSSGQCLARQRQVLQRRHRPRKASIPHRTPSLPRTNILLYLLQLQQSHLLLQLQVQAHLPRNLRDRARSRFSTRALPNKPTLKPPRLPLRLLY